MPRSRKRHHSRSRSRSKSRSYSGDRGHDKVKKPSSHEKDGKRRRLDDLESPLRRSISCPEAEPKANEVEARCPDQQPITHGDPTKSSDVILDVCRSNEAINDTQKPETTKSSSNDDVEPDVIAMEVVYDKAEKLITPKKTMTPKQLQKKAESEKKRQQKQKERDEREKQRQDEKARILAEKQKVKEEKEAERQKVLEEKLKQIEMKKKEKELKEEQKKREKEEKEQKRKEKEDEKLKKQQEIEEKNKEKQKEEEKKLKSAALLKSFFKKTEGDEQATKTTTEKANSYFMPFEVKSDMKLPPLRRTPLTTDQINRLDFLIENQDPNASYIADLKSGKIIAGCCSKTWPPDDFEEEVTLIGEDKTLGEKIHEDAPEAHKMKAKFFAFHENRRPAYYGTWRKTSKSVKPRKPFGQDSERFNYEEDSDDDWEEEEQGESLEISGEEDEKEGTTEEDDYEVDNDFFVPHGHLSDDEIDDEENARLSPESLKQKLKLLKDEFEEDMKSKTHKLKPRFIGCVWVNANGDNVDEAIYRYLQPYAMLVEEHVDVKNRSEILGSPVDGKKGKVKAAVVELPPEHISHFLKIINGNANKKKVIVEEFLTFMANNGHKVEVSKSYLLKFLKSSSTYKKPKEGAATKNMRWLVNDDVLQKYNVKL